MSKVIIAGGRDLVLTSDQITEAVAKSGFLVTQIVSGNAKGVDTSGENWANAHGIAVVLFPALWDLHGKAAGPIRNREMATFADCLIAFPGGPGTANMIATMKRLKKPVYVVKG